MLWLPITLAAAAVQTLRFMLQKQLRASGLSVGGATFSRFLFGAPIAAMSALLALGLGGGDLPPTPGARFALFVLAGGAAQVTATWLTVALFSLRNFAVGVAFTKTETVQVALFSALVLGEAVGPAGWLAIAIGMTGVLLLSRQRGAGGFSGRATLYGILAGGLFALSSIFYRGATIDLMPLPFVTRALVTLACVTAAQSVGMALWLAWREPGELSRTLRAWRRTVWVGVTGIVGSAGWFCAFALQNAAYVRAVGQVEVVFTMIISALVFQERLTLREAAGILLVVASLIAIVLAHRA